jgi:hypothetical protein
VKAQWIQDQPPEVAQTCNKENMGHPTQPKQASIQQTFILNYKTCILVKPLARTIILPFLCPQFNVEQHDQVIILRDQV